MSLLIEIPSTGDSLHFDITISESYRLASTITEYPVEDGGDVEDHIQAMSTPFSVIAMMSASRSGLDGIAEAKAFLTRNSAITMDVTTQDLGLVESCGLTSGSWGLGTDDDTAFSLEFRRITTATSRDVTLPARQSRKVTPPGEADLGEQATAETEDEPEKEAGDKSFLASLFGY